MKKMWAMMLVFLLIFTSLSLAENFKVKTLPARSTSAGPVEYVRGEILIKFHEGLSKGVRNDLLSAYGTSVLSVHYGGVQKLAVPAGMTELEFISQLERDPNVEFAELNTICHAAWVPNDPYYNPYQWHFPKVNSESAWDISTGSGVIVGILDSGIAYENYAIPSYELNTVQSGVTQYVQAPDFAGTSFAPGYDCINNDSHPNDNNGHGTHVAGTVAQTTNNGYGVAGLAFNCTLMPVKVLDYTGSGSATDLIDGIEWATDNGAQVINMSLSWPPGYDPGTAVHNAVTYAYNNGVVLIGSSGNEGVSPVSYPAAYAEVIAVGATRYDDQLTNYSQYGSAQELVAPGGDLDVDQNGDGYGDGVLQNSFDPYDPGPPEVLADPTTFSWWFYIGTSQAAPHVSALVAMMIANGQTGVENIRTILHETAVDLGSAGWDQTYGYGRIDAYAALTYGGCDLDADFSADVQSGCAPLEVIFTDLSTGTGIDGWDWDFGDGGTSTAQNPSYTYETPGVYTVALTVSSSSQGCNANETKTGFITVSATPAADFSGSPTSGCAALTVSFSDLSTGNPTSWDWDFGDGGSSTEQNPTYEYADAGDYTVTLTATNMCGSDVAQKVGYIHVDPPCGGKALALSDIPVIGTVSGNYTDTHVSDNGYEVITEVEYTGHPRKRYSYLEHKWNFNIGSATSATFYVEAYRPNNSDGDNFAFAYSTDDVTYNALLTVASATEQVYSAGLPGGVSGTLYIRVTDTNRSWDYTSLDPVYIDDMYIEYESQPAPPVAEFSGSPTSGPVPLTVDFTDLSTGSPDTWDWTFGDGGTSTAQNPVYEYTAVGKYTVTLTVTNPYGTDSETKVDYINVTDVGNTMHVHDMVVGRVKSGPNYYGTCTVTIYDNLNNPVSGATVYVSATGPTGGDYSDVTGGDGTVSFETAGIKKPSGEWCFEVTDVTHASYTYDPGSNNVTLACESGWINRGGAVVALAVPQEFSVSNYPNPFNPETEIHYTLPVSANVTLEIFNIVGQRVATLVHEMQNSGYHLVTWNASDVPSGVYFYRIAAGEFTATNKMVLMK